MREKLGRPGFAEEVAAAVKQRQLALGNRRRRFLGHHRHAGQQAAQSGSAAGEVLPLALVALAVFGIAWKVLRK